MLKRQSQAKDYRLCNSIFYNMLKSNYRDGDGIVVAKGWVLGG